MRLPRRPRAVFSAATVAAAVAVLALATGACGRGGDDPIESAFRLDAEPCRGSVGQRASAAAVAPDLVATVAHPLEGAVGFRLRNARGEDVAATLAHLDRVKDIALLRLERPNHHHLELVAPEGPGPVRLVTYAVEDGPEIEQGQILELVDVTLEGEGRRAAARLEADVDPGDSGAPVVDPSGRMVAMVFATVRREDRGWAISAAEVSAAVGSLDAGRPGVVPLAC